MTYVTRKIGAGAQKKNETGGKMSHDNFTRGGATMKNNAMKKGYGRYGIIIIILILFFFYPKTIQPASTVSVEAGDGLSVFFRDLSFFDRLVMQTYLKTHDVNAKKLEVGVYTFSGSYTPQDYIKRIVAGVEKNYTRVTMLEGWSIYDIDAMLVKKTGLVPGDFVRYATDADTISYWRNQFPFLPEGITTLEGFLYPDTYYFDQHQGIGIEFVRLALKRFEEKILPLRQNEGLAFKAAAQQKYGLNFSLQGAIALSSVIEKEERAAKEKPTIAGIFMSRLSQDIQLGADITLCYGLQEPYETCTPSRIGAGIYDTKNLYNTRVHKGLPPTPISSVTDVTFGALMHFVQTPYLFYLHDASGKIHYAETNAEHEENKAKFL